MFNHLHDIAVSFPEVTVNPHFESISYRVKNKIFATHGEYSEQANIKLNKDQQDYFVSNYPDAFSPVPNKWGERGWTLINLEIIELSLLKEALIKAYCNVAPQSLSKEFNK